MSKNGKKDKKSGHDESADDLLAQCPEKIICGKNKDRVKITYNNEVEFKLALIAEGKNRGNEVELMDSMWRHFKRVRAEQRQIEMGEDCITLSTGRKIVTPLSEETKARRVRDFFITADHPQYWEMRVEGARTTVKHGNGAHSGAPILSRAEIVMDTAERGPPAFSRLPEPYKGMLTRVFGTAVLFPGFRTISTREKLLVDTQARTPQGKKLKVMVEWARDIGVGENFVGDKHDINELEAEVKYIYLGDTDIKKHPEKAGMTKGDILELSKAVLGRERQFFMEFFMNYQRICGLDDCRIEGIYKSKSAPGTEMLGPVFEKGGSDLDKAIRTLVKKGFQTFPELKIG